MPECLETAKLPTFEEFLTDVKASIPISIFFCANFKDLDQSSISSDLERCYGPVYSDSVQDLQGSFHKLQNSYSLYILKDQEMSSIRENVEDSDDESDEEDDDDCGIIISFGGKNPEPQQKPDKAVKMEPKKENAENPNMVLLERKPVTKVPTVASDKELEDILEARSNELRQKKKSLDPRKARALRRKLYLDLYGEVAQRMLI